MSGYGSGSPFRARVGALRGLVILRSLQALTGVLFAGIGVTSPGPAGLAMTAAGAALLLYSATVSIRGAGATAALTGLVVAGNTGAHAVAVTLMPVVTVELLVGLAPLFALLAGGRWGERLARRELLALALGLAGGAVATGWSSDATPAGVLLALLAAALTAVAHHRTRAQSTADAGSAAHHQGVLLLTGGIALLIIGAPGVTDLSSDDLLALAAVAAIFALTNLWLFQALTEVGATMATMTVAIRPVVAGLVAALALAQVPSVGSIVGGTLCVLAVAFASPPALPRRTRPATPVR